MTLRAFYSHSSLFPDGKRITINENRVKLKIDLSPCNECVTDFAKKRPITANGCLKQKIREKLIFPGKNRIYRIP